MWGELDFWYGWSETKRKMFKRGGHHEKVEPSSYHTVYWLFYPQQLTHHCHWMGWKGRFKETYQGKIKWGSLIWWTYYLEFHETDFKCTQTYALKTHHASRS
jgi:hypothetical protein